jgi:hypothetical protein
MTSHRSEAALNQGLERPLPAGDDRTHQLEDPMARLTVTLPRTLCRRARLHALDQDITISALMTRLIRRELKLN